ncbi:MAG: ABC transporter substrate-binding protein [Caldisericia bacterium]|nr:ABC transporter substrate-binding protein [Caldisericia bacterium]
MKKIIIMLILIFFIPCSTGCQKRSKIHIGIAEDQSSRLMGVHKSLSNGRKLAMQNSKGQEYIFDLVHYDTQNDPENTANNFRKFFQTYETGIMLGTPSVECAQVAKFVADTWGRTFICDAFQSSIVENVSTTLLINQNPVQQGKLIARYVVNNLSKKRVCVVYDSTNEIYKSIKQGFYQEGIDIGATVMEISFMGINSIDPNALFAKIMQSNADSIFLLSSPESFDNMLKIARNDFNIHSDFIFSILPEKLEIDSVWNNVFFMIPFFEKKDSYVNSEFYVKFKNTYGINPDYYAALGADEIYLLQYLMAAGKGINNCYVGLKNSSIPSEKFLTGIKGFDRNGLSVKPIDILKISNNELLYIETFWHKVTRNDM